MKSFFIGLKSTINEHAQNIILVVLAIIVILSRGENVLSFAIIPVLLVLLAVYLLSKKEQLFAANLVMLILLFESGLRAIFMMIFSTDFSMLASADYSTILFLIGSLYLFLIVISYFLADEDIFLLDYNQIVFPLIVFSLWGFIGFGLGETALIVVVAIIASSFGSTSAALLILLSKTMIYPIAMLSSLLGLSNTDISQANWIIGIISLFVVFVIVKKMFLSQDSFFNKRSLN